jgi:hypothetical protein
LSREHLNLAPAGASLYRDFEQPAAKLEQVHAVIAGKIICILNERKLSTINE